MTCERRLCLIMTNPSTFFGQLGAFLGRCGALFGGALHGDSPFFAVAFGCHDPRIEPDRIRKYWFAFRRDTPFEVVTISARGKMYDVALKPRRERPSVPNHESSIHRCNLRIRVSDKIWPRRCRKRRSRPERGQAIWSKHNWYSHLQRSGSAASIDKKPIFRARPEAPCEGAIRRKRLSAPNARHRVFIKQNEVFESQSVLVFEQDFIDETLHAYIADIPSAMSNHHSRAVNVVSHRRSCG